MKQPDKKIKQIVSEDDKLTTQINTKKNDLDNVINKVNDLSKKSGNNGGKVEINVLDESNDIQNTLEFVSNIEGEDTFIVKGNKYKLVNAKKSGGENEIGVFCHGNEKVIPFSYFKDNILGKKVAEDTVGTAVGNHGDKNINNDSVGLTGDDYESVSRGSEQGEVGGSDWEELISLLEPTAPIKEVKGRITKSKLEEHVKNINNQQQP